MNIFAVHPCPVKSAEFLDDARVRKMVLESTQLLCTAINLRAGKQVTPYKNCYIHNQCTTWARTSIYNWMWLFQHGVALALEYQKRRQRRHKCHGILEGLEDLALIHIPMSPMTPFLNKAKREDLGIDYTHLDDVHEAYELYLNHRWRVDKREPTWYGKTRPILRGVA